MGKTGFESGQEVRFIERTGDAFPAFLTGVDEFDMQRPGIYSDGEYFKGDGVSPTRTGKNGEPHKIISRGYEVSTGVGGLGAGEGSEKKVMFCADLAINFGNDKSGTRWIIKRNVLKLYDAACGAVIPPSCGYLDLDEYEEWKKTKVTQEKVRQERLERLTSPEKYLSKPEFQQEGAVVEPEGEIKSTRRARG